jgi:micrococcal nuclease
MYQYSAKLVAIVDGDTIDVDADLGFSVTLRLRLRLAQINAPETGTPEGRAARAYLAELLRGGPLTINTFKDKREKYGRYLAIVYAGEENMSAGNSVNARMMKAGHAVEYMK